ncbi:hypothetical protein HK097_008061 [Rhizophlyctis rosea]|uniref:HMG box domain-containing protein n=1 Tax=Rhizophlyctis rosea TaxID=64517 RepID=A0AAD5SCC7_9FUNG|nr:hypothetical protein HK097_008061 [Rhizophlyctis rosea]
MPYNLHDYLTAHRTMVHPHSRLKRIVQQPQQVQQAREQYQTARATTPVVPPYQQKQPQQHHQPSQKQQQEQAAGSYTNFNPYEPQQATTVSMHQICPANIMPNEVGDGGKVKKGKKAKRGRGGEEGGGDDLAKPIKRAKSKKATAADATPAEELLLPAEPEDEMSATAAAMKGDPLLEMLEKEVESQFNNGSVGDSAVPPSPFDGMLQEDELIISDGYGGYGNELDDDLIIAQIINDNPDATTTHATGGQSVSFSSLSSSFPQPSFHPTSTQATDVSTTLPFQLATVSSSPTSDMTPSASASISTSASQSNKGSDNDKSLDVTNLNFGEEAPQKTCSRLIPSDADLSPYALNALDIALGPLLPEESHLPPLDPNQVYDIPPTRAKKLKSSLDLSTAASSLQPPKNAPRPANCFILYRKKLHGIIAAIKVRAGLSDRTLNNNTISKVVAKIWAGEDEDVRDKYKRFAQEEKEVHNRKYPFYKYRPRKACEREGRGKGRGGGGGGGGGVRHHSILGSHMNRPHHHHHQTSAYHNPPSSPPNRETSQSPPFDFPSPHFPPLPTFHALHESSYPHVPLGAELANPTAGKFTPSPPPGASGSGSGSDSQGAVPMQPWNSHPAFAHYQPQHQVAGKSGAGEDEGVRTGGSGSGPRLQHAMPRPIRRTGMFGFAGYGQNPYNSYPWPTTTQTSTSSSSSSSSSLNSTSKQWTTRGRQQSSTTTSQTMNGMEKFLNIDPIDDMDPSSSDTEKSM